MKSLVHSKIFIFLADSSHTKISSLVFILSLKETSWSNSVDPDQTAHRSNLIWFHTACLYTKIH